MRPVQENKFTKILAQTRDVWIRSPGHSNCNNKAKSLSTLIAIKVASEKFVNIILMENHRISPARQSF